MNKEVKLSVFGTLMFLVMMLGVCDFAKAGGSGLSRIKIHQSDESVLKVKVDVSAPARIMRKTKGGEFIELGWPAASKSGEIGTPALPVVRKLFVAPFRAEVTVDVSSGRSSIIDLTDDEGVPQKIMPVQAPIEKRPGAMEQALFHFDMDAYNAESYLPAERVVLEELGIVRGQRLFLLEMRPVSYNPVAGKIAFWPELSATIYFKGGKQTKGKSVLPGLDKIVINPEILARGKSGSGNYLIIVASVFETAIGPFATAKTNQGFTVTTYPVSPGTSNTTIKSYIEGLWGTADAPDYILLVGDTDTIPCWTGGGDGLPDTDLPYSCMDGGDDWYPDIALGRFPVRTTTQLDDVVDKTLAFEERQFTDNDYVNRAVFMASCDNYAITEGTHNWVIDNYMTPYEISSDKLYCHTYSATTQQVRDSFNDGRLYGIYSGHGSEYSWADGPPFTQTDIDNLTNAGMYPLVLSFACVTGTYTLQECFTETWLLAPEKGTVAVYGSSVNSYWTEDDQLEKDLFRALFDDEIREIGPCWNATRMRYLGTMGAGFTTRRYFEMYNLMGDPSVYIPMPGAATGMRVTPWANLESEGPEGGPFIPDNKAYTLTNNDPNAIFWTAHANEPWVEVIPDSGPLEGSGGFTTVAIYLNANANSLEPGFYTSVVTFTDETHDTTVTRDVELTVNWPPPELVVTVNEALCPRFLNPDEILTVYDAITLTNVGEGPLEWSLRESKGSHGKSSPVAGKLNVEPGVRLGEEEPWAKDDKLETSLGSDGAKSQGGPDSGGYTFIDSEEPGGPAFNWVDISGTGTNLNLTDDSHFFPINLPFAFNFYDGAYTQVAVCSNGTVYFEDSYLTLSNVSIPSSNSSGVDRFIALYWDDLNPGASGDVYYEIVGSAPHRKLVVQFENVSHYGSVSDTVTAQAQLFEGSGDILLLYDDPSSEVGSGATVGIQGDTGTGLEYLYNSGVLEPGLAILFSRGVSWFDVEPTSGTLLPLGDSVNLDVTFDASGLSIGFMDQGLLLVESNDPCSPEEIQICMEIGQRPVLHAEPNITPGLCNTISWNALPGAQAYYAECSSDPTFQIVDSNSTWITGTSYQFCDLISGQVYNYRVKARTCDIETWLQTSQVDFEADVLNEVSATAVPGDVVLSGSKNLLFGDDFEDGDMAGWLNDSGSYLREVTSATAAAGTVYSITLTGGSNSHKDGVSYDLASITPDDITFYVRSSSTTNSDSYFVVGTGPENLETAVFFFAKSTGQMGIYDGTIFWGTTYAGLTWYKIRFAFDWQAKTVDYYVNDDLIQSDITFRGTGVASLTKVYLYNFEYSQAWWDEIKFSEGSTGYVPSGNIISTQIDLPGDGEWDVISFNATTPASTSLTVDALDGLDESVILADVSSGTDISGIAAMSLKLRANLSTSDPNWTPALYDWSVSYASCVETDWSNVESSRQCGTPGDFEPDCDVDLVDFAVLGLAWLTEQGQPEYNPVCDISIPADNLINMQDVVVLAAYWLEGAGP